VKDLAHDAVREQVPGLVATTISSHVPAMIDEVRAAHKISLQLGSLVFNVAADCHVTQCGLPNKGLWKPVHLMQLARGPCRKCVVTSR
jgi:hypothetical protein